MCVILLSFLLLCLEYTQAAEIACRDGNETRATLTRFNDGMVGRYLAKWCINVDPKAPLPTNWSLQLTYFQTDHYCIHPPKSPIYSQGKVHSIYSNETFVVDSNCTHICLNATIDLVFYACYQLKTYFGVDNQKQYIADTFFHVENEYTEAYIRENTALVSVIQIDKENITFVWHTGVPFHRADMELTQKITEGEEIRLIKVEAPTSCIAPSQTEVKCYMRLRPGQYHTQLNLYAPWMDGVFRDQQFVTYDFNVSERKDDASATITVTENHAISIIIVSIICAVVILVFVFRKYRNYRLKKQECLPATNSIEE